MNDLPEPDMPITSIIILFFMIINYQVFKPKI